MVDNPFDSKDFDALLDDFISKQLADTEDSLSELEPISAEKIEAEDETMEPQNQEESSMEDYEHLSDLADAPIEDKDVAALAMEEKRLYNAYYEFIKSIRNLKKECNLEDDLSFSFSASELLPRFKPSRTDNLKNDINTCWDIMIRTKYDILEKLSPNATDEQILDFAEKISAPNLQLSLISYVETLIEIDACETAYNLRKAKYEKHKIEKMLFEEHQRIVDRKRRYAQAIKDHHFPVDGELLVNNFFKNARKDPDGAEKVLEQNPATYAPIQVEKIPNRFFGMIKAKPSDGIRINKKLGKFLRELKS